MLFLALFGLAAFQTVLIRAQDRLDDLNEAVAEQEALDRDLQLQLAELQSPERIAQVARERLGMIAPYNVTFLEPSPDDDAAAEYVPPSSTPSTTAPKSPTTTAPKSTSTTAPKSPTTTAPKSPTTTTSPSSTAAAQKSAGTGR
jgi:cell division protein FtsL